MMESMTYGDGCHFSTVRDATMRGLAVKRVSGIYIELHWSAAGYTSCRRERGRSAVFIAEMAVVSGRRVIKLAYNN